MKSEYSGGGSFDSISYNDPLRKEKEDNLKKIEQEIRAYVPQLPGRTCTGCAEAKLEELGLEMLELYGLIGTLAKATGKMLQDMGLDLMLADQSAAQMGSR